MLNCELPNCQAADQTATGTSQKAVKQQLGSEKMPIFVKRLPTEEEKAAGNEEKKIRDSKSAMDVETLTVAKEARAAARDATKYAGYGVLISLVLAAIALVQYLMFAKQLGLMKTSNNTAELAARSALIQAQNAMDAERAYVKLSHLGPGVERIDDQSSVVNIEVKNWGRTPAHVTDVMIGFTTLDFGTPLPLPYPYPVAQRESFPNGFLVPSELLYVQRHVRTQKVSDTSKQLWIFGHVDYIDIFNRRWRGGYARKYVNRNDNNLVYNTEARDNFDRERTPDEGHDWDAGSIAAYNGRKKNL